MKRTLVAALVVCLAYDVCKADVLQRVVIVTRHGVRAPTWTPERLKEYSVAPWPDFGVPPGYLTPQGRVLMRLMGSFYRESYSATGLLQDCASAKRIYFWADTDQRTIESARALAEGMQPCVSEVFSNAPGTNDPLFNALEADIAKPDVELNRAALEGRIGPHLEAVGESYQPAFKLLAHVLNGDGKAPKSIFDTPIALKSDANGLTM